MQKTLPAHLNREGLVIRNGARGTRTPKPFRALAFEASALPFCQRSKQPEADHRVGREPDLLRRLPAVLAAGCASCDRPRSPVPRGLWTCWVNRGARIQLRSPSAILAGLARQRTDLEHRSRRSARTSGSHPRANHHRTYGLPIGAPGFEPGTSATRTQRSTGLSHAPEPIG